MTPDIFGPEERIEELVSVGKATQARVESASRMIQKLRGIFGGKAKPIRLIGLDEETAASALGWFHREKKGIVKQLTMKRDARLLDIKSK